MSRPHPSASAGPSLRRIAGALGLAALILAGCAAPPPAPPAEDAPPPRETDILASDREFAIVVVQRGETLAALAQKYLGDPGKGWWIAEFNGIEQVQAGQEVVIPLRNRNVYGVYASGFQTIPILCYHRFGANKSAMTVTQPAFEQQMDYLAKNGYRVIPLAHLARFLDGKEPMPKKTVAITIDDGYRATYQIAYPVLKKYNFPATVYLYTDFVGAGDALTWPQMEEMVRSGVIEIQPHSKTHSNLTVKLAGGKRCALRRADAQGGRRADQRDQGPACGIDVQLRVPVRRRQRHDRRPARATERAVRRHRDRRRQRLLLPQVHAAADHDLRNRGPRAVQIQARDLRAHRGPMSSRSGARHWLIAVSLAAVCGLRGTAGCADADRRRAAVGAR
jgi:hypothetical protein